MLGVLYLLQNSHIHVGCMPPNTVPILSFVKVYSKKIVILESYKD